MNRYKVLIIENEERLSQIISQNLENMGYNVISVVESARVALNFLNFTIPDIIIIDVKLSNEIDGIQAVDEIKNKYKIPIIYISGNSNDLSLSEDQKTSFNENMSKLPDFKALNTTIKMSIYESKMQNHILENENLLKVTLENIEDAVLNVDKNGFIKYMNKSAEMIFGLKKEQAEEMQIDKIGFVWQKNNGKNLEHPFRKNKKKKITIREYRLIKLSTNETIDIESSVTPFFEISNELLGYVYLVKNISERKKNYAIKSRLASIVETSKDAIIGIDLEGNIKNWNKGASEIFGYTNEEIKNKNMTLFLPDDIPDMFPVLVQKMKEGYSLYTYEGIRKRKDGEIISVSVLPSPIMNERNEVEGFSFIIRDITERKKMEKEIIEIGEKQSRRIGQDLHDNLGQQLTGVMLNLKILQNTIQDKLDQDEKQQMEFIENLVRDSINKTKGLAENLITVNLQGEGIKRGIEGLANFAKSIYKTEVVIKVSENFPKISNNIERQLYQITKEAINNSAKYSGTKLIFVKLLLIQNEIMLSIRDEGIGISNKGKKGLGMNIMKYRAGIINGTLNIYSRKNRGTLVLCRVPYSNKEI